RPTATGARHPPPRNPASPAPPPPAPGAAARAPPAAEVEAALTEGAGELLESIRLFDVYTGDQLGEGTKSLAYALKFRAEDRTLTVDEATAARDAAVALASERTGAVLRGA
ncbi:phenylalanine--tRNA ligase subunit beta, partial [Streptomyces sp. NPDC059810]